MARDKATLLAVERAAHERWWESLAGAEPDATRADGWTLRDMVAHVAAWQRYSYGRIEAIIRDGNDPGPPGDTDAFNEAARANVGTWDEVRAGEIEAFERLMDLVARCPDEQIAADEGLIDFVARVNGSEHFEEHPASEFGSPSPEDRQM